MSRILSFVVLKLTTMLDWLIHKKVKSQLSKILFIWMDKLLLLNLLVSSMSIFNILYILRVMNLSMRWVFLSFILSKVFKSVWLRIIKKDCIERKMHVARYIFVCSFSSCFYSCNPKYINNSTISIQLLLYI